MKTPEELAALLAEHAYCGDDEYSPSREWLADTAAAAYTIMANCGIKGVEILSGAKLLGIEAVHDLAENLGKPLDKGE